MLKRLSDMNKKTTLNVTSTGSSLSSKKKDTCMKRFRRFLIWEALVSIICIAEHVGSVYMKETGIISLKKNPAIVLVLKIIQRGTEFIMMFLLAYLVCLKTASKNFTMNYRFPTFTLPIFCKGTGTCASHPDEPAAADNILTGMEGGEREGGSGSKDRSERVGNIREKKKTHTKMNLLKVETFERHNKGKRVFDKPRGKKAKTTNTKVMKEEVGVAEAEGDVEMGERSGSEFSNENPMAKARQRGEGVPGRERR
eukprot:CAMPEP_0118642768 /NCGR_PEP_ID=MMETSP0785-20121206/6010_1 /TAXON_ID=91992 /ORGANISM="Bolidomonas pacifica, Strain CCMP 1866" /LENGTH=253 /DNA_ID=CAMNT_0006534339 /DNA_START=60 /DNA_END=818 /DNA_ORIENTATION=-